MIDQVNKDVISFLFKGEIPQEVQIVSGLNHPVDIIASESNLFICEHGATPGLGAISKIDLNIENPVITDLVSGYTYPRAMCLVGDDLYYANSYLHKITITDETPSSEQVTYAFTPRALIFHEGYLYLAGDDRIRRMNISSSATTLTTFTSGIEARVLALAVKNDELYYGYSNKISKISLTDANPVPEDVITNLDHNVYSLVFYENKLLIGMGIAYTIQSLDISEQNPTAEDFLITTLGQPARLRVINTDLYVAGGTGNRIFKIENLDQLLSVDQDEETTSAKIYPNPASEVISLDGITEPTKYKIIDSEGRIVLNGMLNEENKISINQLSTGLYYLQLNTKNSKKSVIKILVN